MHIIDLKPHGLKLIDPHVYHDDRGFFFESYRRDTFFKAGINYDFPQENHSHSCQHTLRGMHFQTKPGQAKLVRVAHGRMFDVAVDIRPGSPTLLRWYGTELNAETKKQLFIPVGFAHGFCVLSETADVLYKVSSPYAAETEEGFAWNDPQIGIDWPVKEPLLSKRDIEAKPFADVQARLGL